MVLKPVSMEKIAIVGLRKNRQTVISVLHDLEVLQIQNKNHSIILKD